MYLGVIKHPIKGRMRKIKVNHVGTRTFILEWNGGRVEAEWIGGTFDEFIELTLRYLGVNQ
jgi:hypothetical protein